MSIWSGIKYALNSTLGTKDFKPLDKIIHENNYVISSDSLLYKFEDEISNTPSIPSGEKIFLDTFPKKIKMNTFGSFVLKADLYAKSANSVTITVVLNVYKNGVHSGTFSISADGSDSQTETKSDTFYFDTDDEFSFELKTITQNSYSGYRSIAYSLSNLRICGTVQTSTFKPIPIEITEA